MPEPTTGPVRVLNPASTPEEIAGAIRDHGLASVLRELRTRMPEVFLQLARHIHLNQLLAQNGAIGAIAIDKVILGNATVGSVKLQNTTATLASASAFLSGVNMNLELKFLVNWWYDIGLWDDSGTWDLGSMWISLPIGNVTIPSLGNMQMNIPAVTLSNIQAQIPALTNLNLGSGNFTGLKVTDTTLPTAGFSIDGMSLGNVSIASLGVPATLTKQATIERFLPSQQVVLPTATLSGLQIPATSVPGIQSGAFGVDAQASEKSLGVDAGLIGITVRVIPIAHMHVDSMHMDNLALSAQVGSVTIENVSIPVDVRGIVMKDLALTTITAQDITA